MASTRIRLGIIGNGDAAVPVLTDVERHGGFDVVGAADVEARARDRFTARFAAPAYADVRDLVDNVAMDAVYIATPTPLHEAQTLSCLEAGVHVLVEKPIATTLDAAEHMIAAAAARGLTLMVNHKRSVDRPIIAMWHLVRDGALGRVRAVHRWHYTDWFYRPRGAGERDPETGGVVLRQGAHEFDIIRLLAHAPARSLRGTTGDYDPERPGEGAYYCWVDHADGIVATSIYGGYGHFASDEFTKGLGDGAAIGAAKRILDAEASTPALEAERKLAEAGTDSGPSHGVYGFTLVNCEFGDLRAAPGGGVYCYDDTGRRLVTVDGIAGTAVIVDELHRALTDTIAPLHDGAWGLACLEQCLAIRASHDAGRPVDLTRQREMSAEAAATFLEGRTLAVHAS